MCRCGVRRPSMPLPLHFGGWSSMQISPYCNFNKNLWGALKFLDTWGNKNLAICRWYAGLFESVQRTLSCFEGNPLQFWVDLQAIGEFLEKFNLLDWKWIETWCSWCRMVELHSCANPFEIPWPFAKWKENFKSWLDCIVEKNWRLFALVEKKTPIFWWSANFSVLYAYLSSIVPYIAFQALLLGYQKHR